MNNAPSKVVAPEASGAEMDAKYFTDRPPGGSGKTARKDMGLSLQIATFNGAQRLPPVLQAIAEQRTTFPFELVVVDNGSSDRTIQVVEELMGRFDVPFRVLKENRRGIGHARETSIRAARFPLLSMIDDDCVIASDWVESCCRFFLDPRHRDIAILGSRNIAVSENPLPSWFEIYRLHYACSGDDQKKGLLPDWNPCVFGAGMTTWTLLAQAAVKTPLVAGKDGFRGEDSELCFRIIAMGEGRAYQEESLRLEHHLQKERLTLPEAHKIVRLNGRAMCLLLGYSVAALGVRRLYCRPLVFLVVLLAWVRIPFSTLYAFLKWRRPVPLYFFHAVGITKGFCMLLTRWRSLPNQREKAFQAPESTNP